MLAPFKLRVRAFILMYYTEENEKYHKDIKPRERPERVALYYYFSDGGESSQKGMPPGAFLEIPLSTIELDRDGRDSNRKS